LENLFQLSNYCDSSELSDRALEEISQSSVDTVDTQQAGAVVGPSIDHISTNEPSFYGQDAIGSLQDPPLDCASEVSSFVRVASIVIIGLQVRQQC
jgi:hypothetical protein